MHNRGDHILDVHPAGVGGDAGVRLAETLGDLRIETSAPSSDERNVRGQAKQTRIIYYPMSPAPPPRNHAESVGSTRRGGRAAHDERSARPLRHGTCDAAYRARSDRTEQPIIDPLPLGCDEDVVTREGRLVADPQSGISAERAKLASGVDDVAPGDFVPRGETEEAP